MLKFLRKIRKGFRTACLTATLTTCWQIGQVVKADISPLPNWGDEVTLNFSGSVSPSTKNLSHLFLIYGTSYSGVPYSLFTIKLGDFTAGLSTPFSVSGSALYDETLSWYTIGLYGDISSGQYIEGTNGVTLGITNVAEGDQWSWRFFTSEEMVFTNLLNDTPQNIYSNLWDESWHCQNGAGLNITDSSVLWNFSNASNNGQIEITSEIVPEPISIILFGGGGMIVVVFRRRNK
jgi:hypothetical protein